MNQEDFRLPKEARELFADLVAKVVLARAREVERALVATLEAVLGRVPTEEEVARHGRKVSWPNVPGREGWHYYFKDFYLFTVQDLGAEGPMIVRKAELVETEREDSQASKDPTKDE